jgi:hypothetical protein
MTMDGKRDIASLWAKQEKMVTRNLEKLLEKFGDL